MSRLGRQISRGFKSFGRQLSTQGGTFGRMLSNTGKDIQKFTPQIQKVSDGISKALSPIPIVGTAVGAGNALLKTGLGVVNNVGGALASGGQGVRDLTSGKFDDARQNFQSAVQSGNDAISGGAMLFV